MRKFPTVFSLKLIAVCLLFFCGLACTERKIDLSKAQEYAGESQAYYRKAIREYQGLIKGGGNLEQLYFEIGKLYYDHGDFKQAVEVFNKTPLPEAKKLLGIAHYRLGDFTEGLDVFTKNISTDDEYLYYQGLTCEKLNLFDQALKVYKKIRAQELVALAQAQIELIEKQAKVSRIQSLDPQTSKIIRNAPKERDYPQAGALILSCDEKIEVTAQNSQVSTLHYIVKILNERGKEDFSETQVEYDSTYEKVELIYARTIKPDGTVADVGKRHMRDVSKYLNFPLYSNARIFIISFPEICAGAVIDYQVRIYRNQLVNKKDFVLEYPLQAPEPVISARFIVELPKERELRLVTLNESYNDFAAQLKPQVRVQDGRTIYLWQFINIPQIIPEANMPPVSRINPQVMISTFNSWQEIYQWWWSLAKDKIQADEAIRNKVRELLKGQSLAEDKARAIYNFCAKEIRYVAIEYGQAGYEPHPAADIFRNKYGDCKDQAILLVTMLKEAGLPAWPVLIPTKDQNNLIVDFPTLPFDHCIAAVELGGKLIFLDPTAETCSFGDLPAADQERKILLIKDEGFEIIDTPLYSTGHNFRKEELKITVSRDEAITAEKKVSTRGFYDQSQRYWLLYTPPQLIEESLKERIQGISIGAKLGRYSIKNLNDLNIPVVLDYTFSGAEYFTFAGNLRIMPQLADLDAALVAKDKRRYPIDLGVPDSQERFFELTLPDNLKVKYLPETIRENNPWFKFSVEYSTQGNKLIFKQRQEVKIDSVSQNDYPQFKIIFEKLAKNIKQRIILERIK